MHKLLGWAALLWTCCSICYIAFWDTSLIQISKAFMPPITLALLSIAFRDWQYEPGPDDDEKRRRWTEIWELARLTQPADRTKEKRVVDFEKKSA